MSRQEYFKNYYQDNKEACNERQRLTLLAKRNQVIENLGGKCGECGTTEKLQLHHKVYEVDSVIPTQHEDGYDSVLRVNEAALFPERFGLFCLPCHNAQHPKKGKNVKGNKEVKQ